MENELPIALNIADATLRRRVSGGKGGAEFRVAFLRIKLFAHDSRSSVANDGLAIDRVRLNRIGRRAEAYRSNQDEDARKHLTRIRSATATGSERQSKWKCFSHWETSSRSG